VAAELLKRGLQTSLTLGNAKSIDLFAINDQGTRFTIQVKALRSPNYFLIDLERVQDACYYVFVVLNKPDVPPDYYIVPGCDLRSDHSKFGKWFADYKKMPGIHPKGLAEYRNNWKVFDSSLGIRTEPNSIIKRSGLGVNIVRVHGKSCQVRREILAKG
jgi:hypothetical protein